MNPIINELETQVSRSTDVTASAVALINGIKARIQAGIDAALSAGATQEQLATLTDEVQTLSTGTDTLAAAVAENTPGGPEVTPEQTQRRSEAKAKQAQEQAKPSHGTPGSPGGPRPAGQPGTPGGPANITGRPTKSFP